MLKYFILSLFFASLVWQVLADDSVELPEDDETDDDIEISEFNDTDASVIQRPRFLQVKLTNKMYTFYFQPVNWHMARELCTSKSSVLASIQSYQEQSDIQDYLHNYGLLNPDNSFWIGASELGHLGQWSWVSTGRTSYFNNWRNTLQRQCYNCHCMELFGDGKWGNNDCDVMRPVICENLPICGDNSIYG